MLSICTIIPTYNRAEYITKAIDSVLAQTHKVDQIIVVDDGSTDDTRTRLETYIASKKILYIFQDNSGVSAARNKGIKETTCEWVAFLDSDDEWLPEKIERQVANIRTYGNAVLSCTNVLFIDEKKNFQMNYFASLNVKVSEKVFLVRKTDFTIYFYTSSVLVKRQKVLEAGLFDEQLTIHEDIDLWYRINLLGGNIVVNPAPLVKVIRREERTDLSLANQFIFNKERHFDSLIIVYEKILNYSLSTKQKRIIKEKLSATIYDLGIFLYKKKREKAISLFYKSFIVLPTMRGFLKLLIGLSGEVGIKLILKRRLNKKKGFRRTDSLS